jgi:hypothetical protein
MGNAPSYKSQDTTILHRIHQNHMFSYENESLLKKKSIGSNIAADKHNVITLTLLIQL